MTSLLQVPTVVDSCQTHLRGRRRSSIRPLGVLPLLRSNSSDTRDESALVDDINDAPEIASSGVDCTTRPTVPRLMPLLNAHMPDHATKITIPRNDNAPSSINDVYAAGSPSSTSLPTALHSRKASLSDFVKDSDSQHLAPERLKWRLASGYFAYFMCGWGDGVTGTVLPYFMAEFHMTFMTSSLLYAGSTCGFIIGTVLVESILKLLGRTRLAGKKSSLLPHIHFLVKIFMPKHQKDALRFSAVQARHVGLFVSSILHGMFFVVMGTRGGFPVLFFAYALAAFARAILTGSLNAYFSTNHRPSLGYAFALWSFGGVVSPLLCQALVSNGTPWFRFYFGSLVLSAVNVCFLSVTFNPTTKEFLQEREGALIEAGRLEALPSPVSDTKSEYSDDTEEHIPPPRNTLRLVASMPLQWAVSFFAAMYCGFETTTQGFMATYLLGARHANPNSVGYVTAGFWGGITIGRLFWGYFNGRFTFIQSKNIIHICLAIALIMQILIMVVSSDVANAFCASLIGLICGPVFPACLRLANDILPREVHLVSMAIISTCASMGAALFPFMVGVVSNIKGVRTMSYVTVPLGFSLMILWALLPSKVRSRTTTD